MSTVQSRKAKGRRLQNWTRDTLLSIFKTLDDNDISCAIMGETGEDTNRFFIKMFFTL